MSEPLDPASTALLVMDYQPGILSRVALAAEDDAHVPAHSRFAALVGNEAMRPDAAGTQVHRDLAPQPGDVVVRKRRVGALSTTDLHERLVERGVTTLVLAGLSTSGVVLSTVRDAADRDYRVVVLRDACADPDPELHELLLARVFPGQAEVIGTEQLDGLLL